jgi:methylmalonyl-CoA mutase
MDKESNKQLFSGFPEITTEAWESKIREDLKGASYMEKLVWDTCEGINVKPFYRSQDLDQLDYLRYVGSLKPFGSAPNSWTICQDIFPRKDPSEANDRIKNALRGGAQAIRIHLEDNLLPGRDMLGLLFDGIPLGETEVLFQGCLRADALYANLLDVALAKGIEPFKITGTIGADPLGQMASTGIPIASLENLGKLVQNAGSSSPGIRVINVDGALIQNAGSTLVQELGYSLAMANEYLALLTSRGIDAQDAVHTMQLSLAAGSNYFMEIAKLRAARILWSKICEGYGLGPEMSRILIHSTSSQWNMTLYDPYINMLRGTTEAMSSILGGADFVSVLPFDHPFGKTTPFSDRIARSVQIILRDEAYFGRVADPSSGSYYIENLTDAIAEKSWDLFRETEKKGGFRKAIEAGWIQEKVLESKRNKLDRAASGRLRILGTNAYPDFNEMILQHLLEADPLPVSGSTYQPLLPFRAASMFEQVRLETERTGKRPRVFLFKHGDPAWGTSRASFSGNFFACAGYEIIDPPAFDSVSSGIEAARNARADLVVLCSSDDAYKTLAPMVHTALKEQSVIVVAGDPANFKGEFQKAGIENFIHTKSNLVETLQKFNRHFLGDLN